VRIMSDLREHEDILGRALRRLGEHTPFAEAMAASNFGESVSVDSKSWSTERPAHMSGAAFRAWAGDRWIEGATSSFDDRAVTAAVDGLLPGLKANSKGSPPGPSATTVGSVDLRPTHSMQDVGTERVLERVRELHSWATGSPSIKVAWAGVQWGEGQRMYLNTAGARCFQRLTRTHVAVGAVAAENGRTQQDMFGAGGLGGFEIVDRATEQRIREVADNAVALLHVASPPTGRMNVIFDPGVTATFAHESFGHGTEGDQFVRKRSYLLPLLGEKLAPEFLTLVDDGSLPGAWGSIAFDDEGHPGARTVMIDRGRFVSGLYDRESAAVMGSKPTGNTRRSSFLDRAFVRMTNTLIEPGDRSYEELLEETKDGVVLERWLSGMEDPAGGQLQIKVSRGRRIEHGKETDLLGPMALSGKVLDVLRNVRGIGRKEYFELTPGYCGKGHGDYLPVGDGGSYLLTEAIVGPT
jgi:TldD protein